MLLEQNSIGYIFPDEIPKLSPDFQPQNHVQSVDNSTTKSRSSEQDWQFVIPMPSMNQTTDEKPDTELSEFETMKDGFVSVNSSDQETVSSTDLIPASGIFPAARARLASLRDLGAKKIGALKLKLIENKIKSNERGKKMSFN